MLMSFVETISLPNRYVGPGLKKRGSVAATLPGRELKCSKFSRKEEGKEGQRNGRKGKIRERDEERERNKGEERIRDRKRDIMGRYIGKEGGSV